MLDVKMVGMLVLMFGLLLVMTQAFSITETEGETPVTTLQTWGWVFSAMGLAMMHLKVPLHIARSWAIGVILLIAYIVAASMGWIT